MAAKVFAFSSAASLVFLLKVAIVAIGVGAFVIVGLEVASRIFLADHVSAWRSTSFGDQRVLFISKDALRNKPGYPAYRPDSWIREVAYFPDATGAMTLEYDCTYRSDHLGFLSNSIRYEEAEILLLGDSNAQGQGGCAWLPRLEPELRSRIYSAAVSGHGVKHWRNVVRDLESIRRPPKIMIVFITDDFFRTDWVFDDMQLACVAGTAACEGLYWHPLPENMADNMAERAAERYARRAPGSGNADLKNRAKYHLIATYSLYKMTVGRQQVERRAFDESVRIVTDLEAQYPLKLIWLNQRDEISGPSRRTRQLEEKLKGFDVVRCSIPPDGFMPRDGHPNAAGYDVLKSCVEKAARGWSPEASHP